MVPFDPDAWKSVLHAALLIPPGGRTGLRVCGSKPGRHGRLAAHWAAGNIDFAILFWLLLGSIPGVLIGGRLTLSIPEQSLRLLLAGVLGLAGIKLLNVPGAGAIVVVVLAAGAAGLLVWLGRHSWIRIQRGRNGRLPPAID